LGRIEFCHGAAILAPRTRTTKTKNERTGQDENGNYEIEGLDGYFRSNGYLSAQDVKRISMSSGKTAPGSMVSGERPRCTMALAGW
jgi:hypothetical protein